MPIGGFFRRLLFSIRFGDPNLLLSSDINQQSRIIYMRNVVQIAQHAAPFLSIDAHPYAAIVQGHVDWILDGYTTTDQYPYSQDANTQLVPTDNGLPSSYNYVRNSVKIIVDAYTGAVSLYIKDPHDPILQAWNQAFPGLFHKLDRRCRNRFERTCGTQRTSSRSKRRSSVDTTSPRPRRSTATATAGACRRPTAPGRPTTAVR